MSRDDLGLTQEELAARTGISRPYLTTIEKGRADNVGIRIIESLADALGVTVNYLLGLSDNPLPDDARTLAESAVVYEVDSISQRRRVQRMLDLFTALDEPGQEMALRLMETVRDTYQPRIIGNDS
jgi:transcriptional regulator with XRE-family HTH domain